jgi:hypothetical protein
MNEPLGTFILDFQTTNFGPDAAIANGLMAELQRACELENVYALDPPVERAGWSFAKLFLAGQFVEELYQRHAYEIDRAKGKKFPDKFMEWLWSQLKSRGCGAQVKMAPEMKEI